MELQIPLCSERNYKFCLANVDGVGRLIIDVTFIFGFYFPIRLIGHLQNEPSW